MCGKFEACDFLQYAALIVPSESLTQSLGAPDNRRQRSAVESHNGRSDFLAGTALHAPKRSLLPTEDSGR